MEFVAPGKIQIGDLLNDPRVRALMGRPDGWFCLLNDEGEHLLVSAHMEALTGYSPNEYVKRDLMSNIHSGDASVVEEALRALDVGPVQVRMRCMHKDGSHRWTVGRMMRAHGGICVAVELADNPDGSAEWMHIPAFV